VPRGNHEYSHVLSTQREVALFLDIKDGKLSGAETTPFLLPHRSVGILCVEDYINRNYGTEHRQVMRLYFKRSKGKNIVCLNGDYSHTIITTEI